MTIVVDYSYARPGGLALRLAGYEAAMRYLGSDGRCITPGERDDLHGAGLGIGLIWETSTGRALAGGPAGTADADAANWWADQLDAPDWLPIHATVDTAPTQAQLDGPVTDYFRAFVARSKRPTACYGPYPVIETIVGRGIVQWGWQSAGSSGFGSGSGGSIQTGYVSPVRLSEHTHLFQHFGREVIGETDHNELLQPAPLWWRAGQTQPDGNEEDMTPEDWARIEQLFVDQDTRTVAVLPQAVAARTMYLLSNPDGAASPTYHLEDGTPINLTAALQGIKGADTAVAGLQDVIAHLDAGNPADAADVAREVLRQIGVILATPTVPVAVTDTAGDSHA